MTEAGLSPVKQAGSGESSGRSRFRLRALPFRRSVGAQIEPVQYVVLFLAIFGSLLYFVTVSAAHFDELFHHAPRARQPFSTSDDAGLVERLTSEFEGTMGMAHNFMGHGRGSHGPGGAPNGGPAHGSRSSNGGPPREFHPPNGGSPRHVPPPNGSPLRNPLRPPSGIESGMWMQPEAWFAGLHPDDTILSVDNVPFTGMAHLLTETFHARIGQRLMVIYRNPEGVVRSTYLSLRPQPSFPRDAAWWTISIVLVVVVPALCLLLGYWVVAARPGDLNAWCLLGIMNSVPAFIGRSGYYPGPLGAYTSFWRIFSIQWMLISLVLLGIYFPVRSRLDKRHPWIKWLLIAPQVLLIPAWIGLRYGVLYHIQAVQPYLRVNQLLDLVGNLFAALSLIVFIGAIVRKLFTVPSADARRRLRVVALGSLLGLSPALTLLLLSTFAGRTLFEIGRSAPWIFGVSLVLTLLFPFSLAYTVIVQQSLDVRIFLRQGTRYALARGTLWVVQGAVIILLGYEVARFIQEHDHHLTRLIAPIAVLVFVLFLRLRIARPLSLWIDRRFFREEYSVEQILNGLSEQARGFTETEPLLRTIVERISDALHVENLAVLLRSGQIYRLQYAHGLPDTGGLTLAKNSSTIRTLEREGEPARIQREYPDGWLANASEAEKAVLDQLHAELVLPLPGRSDLIGVMALGPKRSEEPYSPADRRLLQSVALQTGLAIENSQLIHSLAEEAGHRERMNREIEIAQEVQERLFPQEIPVVEGVELAGFCRTAQQVGGDYFDFLPLENGHMGIAAGDVSGKGISAALLMASIRAALRGLTFGGPIDLPGVMQKMNRIAYDSSTTNRFATFFFADYDPDGRKFTYVNAGHNPPLLLHTDSDGQYASGEVDYLDIGGPVMGVFPEVHYEQGFVAMRAGDVLIVYTDGVTESMTAADEEWGDERLLETARSCAHLGPQEIVNCLLKEVDQFTAGAAQHDDLTLVVVKAH